MKLNSFKAIMEHVLERRSQGFTVETLRLLPEEFYELVLELHNGKRYFDDAQMRAYETDYQHVDLYFPFGNVRVEANDFILHSIAPHDAVPTKENKDGSQKRLERDS